MQRLSGNRISLKDTHTSDHLRGSDNAGILAGKLLEKEPRLKICFLGAHEHPPRWVVQRRGISFLAKADCANRFGERDSEIDILEIWKANSFFVFS